MDNQYVHVQNMTYFDLDAITSRVSSMNLRFGTRFLMLETLLRLFHCRSSEWVTETTNQIRNLSSLLDSEQQQPAFLYGNIAILSNRK